MEVRGENFLIPVDFPSGATELEVRDEAYSAQLLLRGLEDSSAKTRIMILDACRDNPLRAARSTRAGARQYWLAGIEYRLTELASEEIVSAARPGLRVDLRGLFGRSGPARRSPAFPR